MKSSLTLILSVVLCATLSPPLKAQRPGPRLGVSVETQGLTIESVTENSVAAKAGLKPGDFLIHWGDRHIATIDDVLEARDAAVAGSDTVFMVRRGDKIVELKYRLPDTFSRNGLILGVTLETGVCIAVVHPNTPAGRAGLQAGDILMELAGRTLESLEDLIATLGELHHNSQHKLVFRRGSEVKTVVVRFPQKNDTPLGEWARRSWEDMASGEGLPPFLKDLPKDPMAFLGNIPSLGRFLELESAVKELDRAIADLEAMKNPALSDALKRIRKSRSQIAAVTRGMQDLKGQAEKLWQDMLQDDRMSSLRGLVFSGEQGEVSSKPQRGGVSGFRLKTSPEDSEGAVSREVLEAISRRVGELTAEGMSDEKEINRIIKREFPGVNITISIMTAGKTRASESKKSSQESGEKSESRPAPTSRPQGSTSRPS